MEPNQSSHQPAHRVPGVVILGAAIGIAFLLGMAVNLLIHPQASQAEAPAGAVVDASAGVQLEYAVFDFRKRAISLPNQKVIQGKESSSGDTTVSEIADLARQIGAEGSGYWNIVILNRLAEDGWYVVSHTIGSIYNAGDINQYLLARPKRK